MRNELQVGLVGAGRGLGFAVGFEAAGCRIAAVCEASERGREMFRAAHPAATVYSDYLKLLAHDLDIVAIATPLPLHVAMTAAALQSGKHVLCEVPPAGTLCECWQLVGAVRAAQPRGLKYMVAENRCFTRLNLVVREMARRGLFGELYFGEGEYNHDFKMSNDQLAWRRQWLVGRPGATYSTHSLAPLLRWFHSGADPVTVTQVSCFGSGHHYRDSAGAPYENDDVNQMLCRLSNGGLVRVRTDLLSARPKRNDYYALQGTLGCYEAPRGFGDAPKIWLADRHARDEWHALSEFESAYAPPSVQRFLDANLEPGFDSGTFIQVLEFVDCIRDNTPSPLDVYASLDMTVPGIVSALSIQRDGELLPVPDFRHIYSLPDDLPGELRELLPGEIDDF